jgi:hypothetical protein
MYFSEASKQAAFALYASDVVLAEATLATANNILALIHRAVTR